MTDFHNLPFIKVELFHNIFENDIVTIINMVMNTKNLLDRPLIKIDRGFCLSVPKRKIIFSSSIHNKICTMEIQHSEFHFDPEIEGLDIYKLLILINKIICTINNISFNENFENIIHVKLNRKQLKKKYLNSTIDNLIEKFKSEDIIIKRINDSLYVDFKATIKIDFVVDTNDVISYIKFNGAHDVLINTKEEVFINRLIGYIFYEIYNKK